MNTQPTDTTQMGSSSPVATPNFDIRRRRMRFLGLTLDDAIKYFFESNAVVSIIVLGLITLFLFREGFDFFRQNRDNLLVYRRAGLELIDNLKRQEDSHMALSRYLSDLRVRLYSHYQNEEKLTQDAIVQKLQPFDVFSNEFADAINPIREIMAGKYSDEMSLVEIASDIKTKFLVAEDRRVEKEQYLAEGKTKEAAAFVIEEVAFAHEIKPILAFRPHYVEANQAVLRGIEKAMLQFPKLPIETFEKRLQKFKELTLRYTSSFAATEAAVAVWNPDEPVAFSSSLSAFLFGRDWLTASFWQDWYGILPLLTGSLMVSFVALCLAVPFGVGAAIYVNQLAGKQEQKFIKPGIEFISAFPSVVLGFFGIAMLGQALRALSQVSWLSWVPGFPFSERLNILTAGCLLALIAVPTIFTLAEDALNNVPRSFKEASFALGATRMQTIIRVIAPAAISGIISAVLLGFGRVIGETMVVLLCAGNRIDIPDFTRGLGVVTEPVHTMTGIIAQEMGEVVRGSIHYRALFVVGIVLFFLSLIINYLAQKIVRKYRISIG